MSEVLTITDKGYPLPVELKPVTHKFAGRRFTTTFKPHIRIHKWIKRFNWRQTRNIPCQYVPNISPRRLEEIAILLILQVCTKKW